MRKFAAAAAALMVCAAAAGCASADATAPKPQDTRPPIDIDAQPGPGKTVAIPPTPSASELVYKTTDLTAADVLVTGEGALVAGSFPYPAQAQKLTTKDVVVGKGKTVQVGDAIKVNYYVGGGVTGDNLESTFGSSPYPTLLQFPGVLGGWFQGIPGMKEGGKRVIVVPPGLGYGDKGKPPKIAPGESLVFVVEVLKAITPGQ